MITSADLAQVPLFANVEEVERQRLARKAADIRLVRGEFMVREGEEPRFFIILEGELEVLKNIVGQFRELGRNVAGEFSGEVPIFMGVAQIVSLRALTPVRAARFERQQLQELVRDSPAAAEIIWSTMSTRTHMAQDMAKATPSSRAYVIGSKYDKTCRAIRNFLAANRIQYNWKPTLDQPDESGRAPLTVDIDRTNLLVNPTVREVVEALGYKTVPKHTDYDVVIAGAGPAGMAAAVYGASEGLRVLIVERFAAGGQAGTSSRIENSSAPKSSSSATSKPSNRETTATASSSTAATSSQPVPSCWPPASTGIAWKTSPAWPSSRAAASSTAPAVTRRTASPANASSSSAAATPPARPPSSSPVTLRKSSSSSAAQG
jgi:thioredoxin reductase (NADPH)